MSISWDLIFSLLKQSLSQNDSSLPSVSTIAQEYSDPFTILISTLLSLRTKDAVTLEASRRLFRRAKTPQQMCDLSLQEIEQCIYPVGFYKTKAIRIQSISAILITTYKGMVPSQKEALLQLPGVGMKTANLTLNLGFGIDAICVDTHVHRISNRMGWIKTKNPEESEKALETIMPRAYWIPLNEILVAFGQQVCSPISPHCSTCLLSDHCKKVGVKTSR